MLCFDINVTVCVCVCVTWLKGHLAEHHPDVCEVKAAAEGLGSAAVQRHRDVAGARVPVVQHRHKRHGLRLPGGDESGLKPTGDGGEDLHALGEHVVTVNLDRGEKETSCSTFIQFSETTVLAQQSSQLSPACQEWMPPLQISVCSYFQWMFW